MEMHGHIISYYVSIYVSIISIISDFIKKEIRNKKESVNIIRYTAKLAQFDNLRV